MGKLFLKRFKVSGTVIVYGLEKVLVNRVLGACKSILDNPLFEVQMSEREWMEASLHLSEFNLGGLSLHTLQLFQESLGTITFSTSGKIFRAPELVEQHRLRRHCCNESGNPSLFL